MKKIILSAIAFSALSATLMAGGDVTPVAEVAPIVKTQVSKDYYVGAAFTGVQTYVDGESNWFSDDDQAETGYGLQVQAGWDALKYGDATFGVEARYGRTFWAYDIDSDSRLETFGGFVKGDYDFGDVSVYGLVGYGQAKYKSDFEKVKESGFAWGIGSTYEINDEYEVFVDYTVYPAFDQFRDDINNDVVAVGVNYHF